MNSVQQEDWGDEDFEIAESMLGLQDSKLESNQDVISTQTASAEFYQSEFSNNNKEPAMVTKIHYPRWKFRICLHLKIY